MRCEQWEERIALHAGGDVTGGDAAQVERHLAECAPCREFSRELLEVLALLRGGHADRIPAGAYTAVRARVMAAIERRRRLWTLAWACAAAAILLAGAGLRREMRVEPVRQVALAPPGPAPLAPVRAAHARPAPKQRRRRALSGAAHRPETIVVKLETDNPDVVIYWIAEMKGAN